MRFLYFTSFIFFLLVGNSESLFCVTVPFLEVLSCIRHASCNLGEGSCHAFSDSLKAFAHYSIKNIDIIAFLIAQVFRYVILLTISSCVLSFNVRELSAPFVVSHLIYSL